MVISANIATTPMLNAATCGGVLFLLPIVISITNLVVTSITHIIKVLTTKMAVRISLTLMIERPESHVAFPL
jgi:hypothetical protein